MSCSIPSIQGNRKLTFSAASYIFLVPIRTPIYTGKDPGLYMGLVREETCLRGRDALDCMRRKPGSELIKARRGEIDAFETVSLPIYLPPLSMGTVLRFSALSNSEKHV